MSGFRCSHHIYLLYFLVTFLSVSCDWFYWFQVFILGVIAKPMHFQFLEKSCQHKISTPMSLYIKNVFKKTKKKKRKNKEKTNEFKERTKVTIWLTISRVCHTSLHLRIQRKKINLLWRTMPKDCFIWLW